MQFTYIAHCKCKHGHLIVLKRIYTSNNLNVNLFGPTQTCQNFVADISQIHFHERKLLYFDHYCLSLTIQLTYTYHCWFRHFDWSRYYLNQWWSKSLTHIYLIGLHWDKIDQSILFCRKRVRVINKVMLHLHVVYLVSMVYLDVEINYFIISINTHVDVSVGKYSNILYKANMLPRKQCSLTEKWKSKRKMLII